MNSDPEPGTQKDPASPRTILVVDDNDNDAALLKLMFRRSRILNPVQAVESIRDAQCYLKGDGRFADRQAYPFPALMLLDSHLGDGSGFDLLRWLQANAAQSPRAVVMLTGTDINAFRMSYDCGPHSFLAKPLKFEDFQNMVAFVRGIKLTAVPEGHVLELE